MSSGGERRARARAIAGSTSLHRVGDRAQRRDVARGTRRASAGRRAARRRTSGTRRLRATASRRARPRCTGGSGRSLRGRARRRSSSRRRRRLRGPSGHLVGRALGGLDLRDAHEVAHRDDADDLVVVDDRDVAVAVLARGWRTRRAASTSGATESGFGGHPLARPSRSTVSAPAAAMRTRSRSVRMPTGRLAVDDDDRTDLPLAHARRGVGDRLGRARGHDRVAHDVADRAGRAGRRPSGMRRLLDEGECRARV